ncbi:MAG: hypothetical protein ACRD1G_08365 [Acidimicrobiales bacterium]
MRIADRYELAHDLGARYWAAGRKGRGELLDAFCLATGYHRKYAIAVLRGRRRVAIRSTRRRRLCYGSAFRTALRVAWEASGYICAERLRPFLPELVPLLEQHGHLHLDAATRELLLQASVSTVERNLHVLRGTLVGRRLSQTKPGTLLRRQIPAVVGRWRDDDVPGYLEIDLVSHSGEVAAGTFIYTLSTVDLSTGWTERIPILGKGERGVVAAMERIRLQLPFRLRGLHPDTGSEFINWQLLHYCEDHGIEFTRSRPFHKNDNAHVEQKNWTLVRRLIGYRRLDSPEQLAWLDALYTELLRPYANCFQPVMKLLRKETVGTRVRRVYDTPTTPLRRLLLAHVGDVTRLQPLVDLYTSLSPLTLKRRLDRRLAAAPAALGGRASA